VFKMSKTPLPIPYWLNIAGIFSDGNAFGFEAKAWVYQNDAVCWEARRLIVGWFFGRVKSITVAKFMKVRRSTWSFFICTLGLRLRHGGLPVVEDGEGNAT
jgi:hypothetical protein